MSGGVDSAVACLLLHQQGYQVVGLTMNLLPPEADACGRVVCCGAAAAESARRVCTHLGIPHYLLNMREAFAESVIAPFCEGYASGRTPNPCIACNREIKFDLLLTYALAAGLDSIATGHYARIVWDQNAQRWLLLKGVDSQKDQSYVLYCLTQAQMRRCLMPLGDMTKERVRAVAREAGLPNADAEESQDICFVPDGRTGEFVAQRLGLGDSSGEIVDTRGRVLGKHRGIFHFTIGQRRGLGIGGNGPLYVKEIRPEDNRVVVGEEEELYARRLLAEEVNWMGEEPQAEIAAEAVTRYRRAPAPAQVRPLDGGRVEVQFAQPQRALTPGQAVVLYSGAQVLAGGTIAQVAD